MTTASETSDAFSDETLKEYTVFQYAKEAEMKNLLGSVADGQIETYRKVCNPLWAYVLCGANATFEGDGGVGQDNTRHTTNSG